MMIKIEIHILGNAPFIYYSSISIQYTLYCIQMQSLLHASSPWLGIDEKLGVKGEVSKDTPLTPIWTPANRLNTALCH